MHRLILFKRQFEDEKAILVAAKDAVQEMFNYASHGVNFDLVPLYVVCRRFVASERTYDQL